MMNSNELGVADETQTEIKYKQVGYNNLPPYILVTEWNDYFSYPTLGALRNLIFNKDTNGFNKVIRKAPRLMVKVDAYFQWVEEINNKINNN